MPPWNSMSPQQQQMLLQMLMSRGTAGMQPGMGAPVGGVPPGAVPGQQMMAPGMQPGMAANNPLMNMQGQMNPAMNSQLMQYMLALRGQPTMAQMLSPQGGNTWGLGL